MPIWRYRYGDARLFVAVATFPGRPNYGIPPHVVPTANSACLLLALKGTEIEGDGMTRLVTLVADTSSHSGAITRRRVIDMCRQELVHCHASGPLMRGQRSDLLHGVGCRVTHGPTPRATATRRLFLGHMPDHEDGLLAAVTRAVEEMVAAEALDLRRHACARRLQRVWRKCVGDPYHSVGRARLFREWAEM